MKVWWIKAIGAREGFLSFFPGAKRRSNPVFFFRHKAGLLRGACHRARIRATRWLAMTVLSFSLQARSSGCDLCQRRVERRRRTRQILEGEPAIGRLFLGLGRGRTYLCHRLCAIE